MANLTKEDLQVIAGGLQILIEEAEQDMISYDMKGMDDAVDTLREFTGNIEEVLTKVRQEI